MTTTPQCQFVPPYILEALTDASDVLVANSARASLQVDASLRSTRTLEQQTEALFPHGSAQTAAAAASPDRTIGDARNTTTTPGATVRSEGASPTGDPATDEAYDGLGDTWQFWFDAFGRDSLDGHGMGLLATVHYGTDYDNAFWDGTQMVFGDGDGVIFNRFTISLDVIGHELAHGVIASTADLTYQGQSGALNESLADVFGSLVKQMARGEAARDANWLVGEGLLADGVEGRGLRDMLNPGTAYDDPRLGADPQPAHMSDYVVTSSDNGGVHLNSGIPNRAFALAARTLGGQAWSEAGQVWWDVLAGSDITESCDFATFAQLTVAAARARFGADSAQTQAILQAWQTVGVLTATARKSVRATRAARRTAAVLGQETEEDADDAVVALRRSGGVAGIEITREVPLCTLPSAERRAWRSLLASPLLQDAPARASRPDGFTYAIGSPQLGVSTTVAESALSPGVRTLIHRTWSSASPDEPDQRQSR